MTTGEFASVPVDAVRRCFRYDPETGKIYRLQSKRTDRIGIEAGTVEKHNGKLYRRIAFRGTKIYAHHIAWVLVYGKWPDNIIDHMDNDGLNNRLLNLQDITQRENIIRGVIDKAVNIYQLPSGNVYVRVDGKYLGSYTTIEEAQVVRANAR